jgi:dienelactone hydrolase
MAHHISGIHLSQSFMRAFLLAALACGPLSAVAGAQGASPFDYDRQAPLNARVVQHTDSQSFMREKVVFDGRPGSRVPALVAFPKGAPGRRAMIVLVDGIGGWKERWWQATSWNRGRILVDSLLAAGFGVAMADAPASGERTFENDYVSAESFIGRPDQWRDMGIRNAIETRRLIDYLATRPDVDSSRIGVLGLSHGGMMTFVLAAVEPRVKSAAAGLTPMHRIPELLLPSGHASRIRIPFWTFAATGDSWYTAEQVAQANALLPSTDKPVTWYDGGHRPPPEYAAAAANWFRRTLGRPNTP